MSKKKLVSILLSAVLCFGMLGEHLLPVQKVCPFT